MIQFDFLFSYSMSKCCHALFRMQHFTIVVVMLLISLQRRTLLSHYLRSLYFVLWFGSLMYDDGGWNVCHCLLFLEKLCDAQFSDVFHEFSRASLNFCRKCSRASSSDMSKTCAKNQQVQKVARKNESRIYIPVYLLNSLNLFLMTVPANPLISSLKIAIELNSHDFVATKMQFHIIV